MNRPATHQPSTRLLDCRARRLLTVTLLALLIAGTLAASGAEGDQKWGPFRGRIVDVDTGQPIAGAAAIVVWLRNVPNPVQGHQIYNDARVAVSDANGEFEIPRRSPPFFRMGIDEPRFDYAAPGYVLWNIEAAWKTPALALMKRLSALPGEQRFRQKGTLEHAMIPVEQQQRLLEQVNAERRRMGLRMMERLGGEQ